LQKEREGGRGKWWGEKEGGERGKERERMRESKIIPQIK
jgi:hypothetical protein